MIPHVRCCQRFWPLSILPGVVYGQILVTTIHDAVKKLDRSVVQIKKPTIENGHELSKGAVTGEVGGTMKTHEYLERENLDGCRSFYQLVQYL